MFCFAPNFWLYGYDPKPIIRNAGLQQYPPTSLVDLQYVPKMEGLTKGLSESPFHRLLSSEDS